MKMQVCRRSLLLQILVEGHCPFSHSAAFPSRITPLDQWDPQTHILIRGGWAPKGTQTSAACALVSHSPASLPPVSRGPAPCPCIPWEPTWDSGLPGPLCTPSSERQSCSRQEGVSGWTRPARPRTPTSLPTPRDESLLGAARPACIAGLKTQFPQNEAISGVLGTGLPGLGTEHLPGALCSGTGSTIW